MRFNICAAAGGKTVQIHGHLKRESVKLNIYREDLKRTPVEVEWVAMSIELSPVDFIETGRGFTVVARWRIPTETPSGLTF